MHQSIAIAMTIKMFDNTRIISTIMCSRRGDNDDGDDGDDEYDVYACTDLRVYVLSLLVTCVINI